MKEVSKYITKNQDFQNKRHKSVQKVKFKSEYQYDHMIKRNPHIALFLILKGSTSNDIKVELVCLTSALYF